MTLMGQAAAWGCHEPYYTCYERQNCPHEVQAGAAGLGVANNQGSAGGQNGGSAGAGTIGGNAGHGAVAGSPETHESSGGAGGFTAGAGGGGPIQPCTVTKVAAGIDPLIDDFADGDASIPEKEQRAGEWLIAKSPTAVLSAGAEGLATPVSGGNPDRAIHLAGVDDNAAEQTKAWGAATVIELAKSDSETSGECYDASRYAGIKLSLRGKGKVLIGVKNAAVRERKSEQYVKEIDLADDWRPHAINWADMRRPSDDAFLTDTRTIYAITIAPVLKPPGVKQFDFWLDNISFKKPRSSVGSCFNPQQPTEPHALISDFADGNEAILPNGGTRAWQVYEGKVEILEGALHATTATGDGTFGRDVALAPLVTNSCVDLSRYNGITFRVKSPKHSELKFDTGHQYIFRVTPQWTRVWIRFADMTPGDRSIPEGADPSENINRLAIATTNADPLDVYLDDVSFW